METTTKPIIDFGKFVSTIEIATGSEPTRRTTDTALWRWSDGQFFQVERSPQGPYVVGKSKRWDRCYAGWVHEKAEKSAHMTRSAAIDLCLKIKES